MTPLAVQVPMTGWDTLGKGQSLVLMPCHSPGLAWRARSPLWCRRPWGRRCGSHALATPPGTSTPGGRKMGSPSPLTGVFRALPGAASLIPSGVGGSVWGHRTLGPGWGLGSLSSPWSPELKLPFHSLRHRLQPDGSLVISRLRAEDAGTYSCGSRPGRDSPKVQLHVTGVCAPPCTGSQGPVVEWTGEGS